MYIIKLKHLWYQAVFSFDSYLSLWLPPNGSASTVGTADTDMFHKSVNNELHFHNTLEYRKTIAYSHV